MRRQPFAGLDRTRIRPQLKAEPCQRAAEGRARPAERCPRTHARMRPPARPSARPRPVGWVRSQAGGRGLGPGPGAADAGARPEQAVRSAAALALGARSMGVAPHRAQAPASPAARGLARNVGRGVGRIFARGVQTRRVWGAKTCDPVALAPGPVAAALEFAAAGRTQTAARTVHALPAASAGWTVAWVTAPLPELDQDASMAALRFGAGTGAAPGPARCAPELARARCCSEGGPGIRPGAAARRPRAR